MLNQQEIIKLAAKLSRSWERSFYPMPIADIKNQIIVLMLECPSLQDENKWGALHNAVIYSLDLGQVSVGGGGGDIQDEQERAAFDEWMAEELGTEYEKTALDEWMAEEMETDDIKDKKAQLDSLLENFSLVSAVGGQVVADQFGCSDRQSRNLIKPIKEKAYRNIINEARRINPHITDAMFQKMVQEAGCEWISK